MKSLFEHYDGMSSVKWRSSWTLGIGQGISFLGSLKWSRRANKQVSRESWYDILRQCFVSQSVLFHTTHDT